MILLHAGVVDGRLVAWGERPAPAVSAPGRRAKRSRAPLADSPAQVSAPLPFGAGAAELVAALEAALPGAGWSARAAAPATAWLPAVAGRAVASHPLIEEPPADPSAAQLAPWGVTVLPLTAAQAVDLPAACLDRDTLAEGVGIGVTLAYWGTALRYAGSLVAREQFLPDVESGGPGWLARWKPVLAGADGPRVHALARAMPPACRALAAGSASPASPASAEAAPAVPAARVLEEYLALVVDELVRSSLGPVAGGRPAAPATTRATGRGRARPPQFDSVHDGWLYALRSPEGQLPGAAAEASSLAGQVSGWKRPVALALASPFRLCFRLEEPPPVESEGAPAAREFRTAGDWHVSYLLQARDDPSLIVPAGEAWTAGGRLGALLKRRGFEPHEYLLTTLGQAAGLCPEVEGSLRGAAPAGFTTDGAGAYRFLTETAWALEQAGFGVMLPAWWTRRGARQRLTLKAHVKSPSMSGGGLMLEDLLEFDWKAALGGEALSLRELETLARLKSPLVQVRGQWVQVGAEELQKALAFFKKQAGGQASVRDLLKMELGAADGLAPEGLEVEGVDAEGALRELFAQIKGEASFGELAPPEGFRGTLRPYQVRGYSWLAFLRRWGLGACLADDMGLGKTVQTLAMLQREREAGEKRPVLLICPMSVVGNWVKEAERFTPGLPVLVHHGQKRARGESFAKEAGRHALVLSSYALLHRDLEPLRKVDWAGLILDEAQNIKNPGTRQAEAARALAADYRVALTGTPVENHVGDLWSIWQFLNPGMLGGQADFKRRFFVPIQVQRDPEASARLKRLTGPFLLRRLKTDKTIIADLPDKQEMKVFCNLTREQATLYAAVVKEMDGWLKGAEGIRRKGIILGTLTRLKQVCNHPAQFLGDNSPLPGRSGKLARLAEMLDEVLQAGEKALVFTQFAEMGELVKKHLQETFGREVFFLHGGVPKAGRDRMVERFQGGDGAPVFVLSLKAGGTGLNLTAANHVFHFDRWWNPAVENQATDRAFRIGQTRNVQVHKFVCVGTLEERIDAMIEQKQEVASRVVGAGEGWLTELSDTQLRDLFALRADAVGE